MSVLKLSIPEPPPGTDPTVYFRSFTNPSAIRAFAQFSKAAVRIPFGDIDTIELIRIRNAAVHSCEY
jgi:hypothetical protein